LKKELFEYSGAAVLRQTTAPEVLRPPFFAFFSDGIFREERENKNLLLLLERKT
jgi:hypothetical protein